MSVKVLVYSTIWDSKERLVFILTSHLAYFWEGHSIDIDIANHQYNNCVKSDILIECLKAMLTQVDRNKNIDFKHGTWNP